MKNILLSTFVLLCHTLLFSQQEQGLHFTRQAFQSNYTNPAFFMKKTVNVSLPSVYTNVTNSTFTWNKILKKDGDSLLLDLRNITDVMQDYNYFAAHGNVEPVGLAIRVKNVQVSAGSALRSFGYVGYERGLFDLLAQGNAPFIGKTINVAPDFQVSLASEINLGVAYRFLEDEKLSVGIRAKYLMGIVDVSTAKDHREMSLTTDPEFYQLKFQTDYIIQSSNAFTGDNFDSLSISSDNLNFFAPNKGFGIDLGAEYRLNERFSFAASVVDIGNIRWKDNTKKLVSNGAYTYDGIRFNQLVNTDSVDFNSIPDTLKKVFEFKGFESDAYTTSLPTRVYLSGTFRPIEKIRVGALFYGEGIRGRFNPALILSGNVDIKEIFSFGLTTGLRNKRIGNIGMNLAFKGGPIQLYMVSDNILGALVPKSSRNFNFRTGLNLLF